MLRHILTTVAMILLPYLVYGIIEMVRRRRTTVVSVERSPWRNAPVLLLGVVGCLLAVAVLLGVAVLDNNSGNPPYSPPVHRESP